MKKLREVLGKLVYVLLQPLLFLIVNKSERTRVVVAVNEEYLLVKPWIGNGKWDLPGGGLKKKETPIKGAIRELEEEVGIKAPKGKVKSLGAYDAKVSGVRFKAHYFLLELQHKPPLKLQKLELLDAGWFAKQELDKIKVIPIADKVLDNC